MFTKSSKFFNWIVTSSVDPQSVSLTVRGLVVMVIPVLLSLLPLVGIHPSFSADNLGDAIYSAVYSIFTAIAAVTTVYGAIRKVWLTIKG